MHSTTTLILVAGFASASLAQGDALQRCPALPDPVARLACYDALLPPLRPPAAVQAPAPLRPPSAPASTLAAPDTAAGFGLERTFANQLQSIDATLESDLQGWGPNEKIGLQDGQVWQIVDGSSASLRTAVRTVKIRRGALGSYYMDFAGLNTSPRVRRLR